MLGIEDIFGGAAILVGLFAFFWRGRRKFNRTNAAGVEQFPSYVEKLSARSWDSILWILGFFSLTGGVLFLANVHESTWGWMVLLPAYLVLLLGVPVGRRK
jgi:hypothetical protein